MDQRKRVAISELPENVPTGSKRTKLDSHKTELRKMYGMNNSSPKKRLVMQGLKDGKDFSRLARELNIATATAEVYGIDCLAAGGELDYEMMASYLKVTKTSFEIIKGEILSSEDKKLRTVRDNLGEVYTYNQLRFVLACLIHELDM